MSVLRASAVLEQNGSRLIQSESVAAVTEVRKAILNDASMTKDLEEQMDNVTIAENIVRRPSSTSTHEDEADRSVQSKKLFNMSPVAVTAPRIEPITERVVPFGSKFPKMIQRRDSTEALKSSAAAQPTSSRFRPVLADQDAQRRTRGSLTSSSDEEASTNTEPIDAVSFSSTGAAVKGFATQTPEDMNSSDDEQTDEEDRVPGFSGNSRTKDRSSSASSDSSESTEEWDSEADTHTSLSDDEVPSTSKPKASYYQVIDNKAAASAPPNPVILQVNPRSLKDQFVLHNKVPWIRRPTFSSMQFPPSTSSARHPRQQMPVPLSRSFPQDFCHMVSNPFFSISLHDAYQQACAFKNWYETHFPDQIPDVNDSHENTDREHAGTVGAPVSLPKSPKRAAFDVHRSP